MTGSSVFFSLDKSGGVDGMAVGAGGNVFSTVFTSEFKGIYKINSNGEVLAKYRLPGALSPTNVAATSNGTLYVTTSNGKLLRGVPKD